MRLEDMSDENVLKVEDIMQICRFGKSLAYKRIREVKSISNIYNIFNGC